jgi:hypothetical protein
MCGACAVIVRTLAAQVMASTVDPVPFRAVTTRACPKRPTVSAVMPSGVSVPGRLTNRRARPSPLIMITPGGRSGWMANTAPLGNEHLVPATWPAAGLVIYGSGPIAVR